jgi:hypothetical protein
MIDKLGVRTRNNVNERAEEIQLANKNIKDITTPNLAVYNFYWTGENLYGKGKYLAAYEEFEKATRIHTSFGLAYFRMAYTLNNCHGVKGKS